MAGYRIYLLDAYGVIAAREDFRADDDELAQNICESLLDACAEHCVGYELWCGTRRVILLAKGPAAPPSLETFSRQVQEISLELLESLRRGHWQVATSERLRETTGKLRHRLGRGP